MCVFVLSGAGAIARCVGPRPGRVRHALPDDLEVLHDDARPSARCRHPARPGPWLGKQLQPLPLPLPPELSPTRRWGPLRRPTGGAYGTG